MVPFGCLFLHGHRDDNLAVPCNQVVRLVRELVLVALGRVQVFLLGIPKSLLELGILGLF